VTGVTAVPDGGRPRRTFPEAIPGRAPGAREAVRRAGRDAGQGGVAHGPGCKCV